MFYVALMQQLYTTVSGENNGLMTGSAPGLCKNILFCIYFCSRFSVGLQLELWVRSMGRAELRPRLNSGILKKKFFLFFFFRIQLCTHPSSLVMH